MVSSGYQRNHCAEQGQQRCGRESLWLEGRAVILNSVVHLPSWISDPVTVTNKATVVLLAGVAFAADMQPTHLAEWLEVSPALVKGSLVGALIFSILKDGSFTERLRYFIVCFAVAYLCTDLVNGLARSWWAALDSPRGWSFGLGFAGYHIARVMLRIGDRAESRATDAADALINRVLPEVERYEPRP